MTIAVLLVEMFLVAIIAGILSYYYGDWHRQHVGVTVAAFLSWYLPMLIVCVLPMDISVTYYYRCLSEIHNDTLVNIDNLTMTTKELLTSTTTATTSTSTSTIIKLICKEPWLNINPIYLRYFWRVVYWTSQFLTWILLPIMQSFAKAGNFTILGKLKASLIDNAVYYGTYLIIFIILFIYVVFKGEIDLSPSNIKVTVITAANTWGLFLVILFLGYGLVEIPRLVWRAGNPELSLRRSYFQLSRVAMDKVEYEEELEDCLKEVYSFDKSIQQSSHLRNKFIIILEKSREVYPSHWNENQSRNQTALNGRVLSEKDLIALHKRLKVAQQRYQRSQALWKNALKNTIWLEEIEHNRGSRLKRFRSAAGGGGGQLIDDNHFPFYSPTIEWYWKCALRPLLLKGLASCLIALSIAVVWSECTFFVKEPTLSIYAAVLQSAAKNYNFLTISLISFTTIGYLCVAVYSTVFHLRIFNYFQLVGNHQSDENSMIFCGMLLCRLTPPLCLNFLGLVHLDSHVAKSTSEFIETAYTRTMGHLDVITFISSGFNLYFPMLVVVLCLATLLRLGTRCLHACGFEQFMGSGDELTVDAVEEGKSLVKRERAQMNRQARLASAAAASGGGTTNASDYNTVVNNRHQTPSPNYPIHSPRSEDRLLLLNDNRSTSSRENPAFDDDRILPLEPIEYNEEAIDEYLGDIAPPTGVKFSRNNNSISLSAASSTASAASRSYQHQPASVAAAPSFKRSLFNW